jgi:hypothetical protein
VKSLTLALLLAGAALASTPSFWELSTFSDFVKGKLNGVSLSRDGHLSPAPKLDAWFVSEQPVIWAIAQGPDGVIYSATGHSGRVFRTEPNGTSKLLWTADRPEVFALAIDPKGILYAASSPEGKIYRIENGKATEYFDPKTRYIWSLAFAADGTLYAGTGEGGRVFRITAAGRGEPWYATGQGNVTSLMFDQSGSDPKGRLLAGTEPNGILFNITAKDKAFALYDSSLPEIRAVAPGPDGSIYAAALGGALAKKLVVPAPNTPGASDANITSTTSITVTAAAGGDLKPPPAPVKPPNPTPETPAAAVTAPDNSNAEKSAIYRINADNSVDTLWSTKEENIYDILPTSDGVYFGTDVNGRIYRLTNDRRLTLIAQTNEAEITRLLQINGNILAVTGNMGKIYKLGSPAPRGAYESSVFDAGGVSRWGKFQSQSTGTVAIQTRTGNSAHIDSTWSEWTPLTQAQIASPNARYLQFSAELSGKAEIENISAAYLPQNTAPTVRSITIISTPAPAQPTQKTATPTFSVTVTDTGDATPVSSTGTPTQTISHAPPEQLTISWSADDPEGDRLVYALDFRGEGETIWKSIKQDLHDASYSIDGDALPDGRYYFRVTASDREVNPTGAKQTELVSAPILVDNAPPVVHIQSAARAANGADIAFDAQDAGSALRRAEWSIDAGHWNPVAPIDGIIDSPSEQFRFRIDAVPAGEHLLVIRVADSAGNTGLGKVVLH